MRCVICGLKPYKSIICEHLNKIKYQEIGSCVYRLNYGPKKKHKFFETKEWAELRHSMVKTFGNQCMRCKKIGKVHVDHIKPKSKYPKLSLYPFNLQILCEQCNTQKGNKSNDDYRTDNDLKIIQVASNKNKVIKKYCGMYKHIERSRKNKLKNKKNNDRLEIERQIRMSERPKVKLRKRQ